MAPRRLIIPSDLTAAFVSANPASPSQIAVNDTITLTFDNPPEECYSQHGCCQNHWENSEHHRSLQTGSSRFDHRLGGWRPNTQLYRPRVPDTEAPKITSSSVNNGDKDVDPEALNLPGRIEVTFNETVTGNIALRTAAGY